MLRKLPGAIALALLVAACGDHTTDPVDAPLPGVSSDISDATREGGNPGFHWLEPMVAQPSSSELQTFVGDLSPKIDVVCWETTDETVEVSCSPEDPGVIDTFVKGDGLIEEADHYKVDFDTHAYSLHTSPDDEIYTTYRIRAYTDPLTEFGGPFLMGWADFQLGENGGAVRSLSTDDMIGLVDNRTLPIRFHVNSDAYQYEFETNQPTGTDPGDALCEINCSVTVIPPGETTEASLFSQDVTDPDGNPLEVTAVLFDIEPDEPTRVLVIDERVEEGDGANCAPGVDSEKKNCFRYEMSPSGPTANPFQFGVCPVDITFGEGIWQLSKVDFNGEPVVTAHGDVDVSGFLPCPGNDGSSSSTIGLLQPVLDFLAPPLYAEDTRLWGGTANDFSDILWEIPAEISAVSAINETVATPSTETLTVQVVGTHSGGAIPLDGVDVTFTVTDGAGTLGDPQLELSTVTTTTDVDGNASVALNVSDLGETTVEATSPDASGDPIVFSRVGETVITTTELSLAVNPAGVGTTNTLLATVTPAPPEGSTVEFFDGATSIGTAATDASGSASLDVTLTSALEPQSFSASFTGAGGYEPSASTSEAQHKWQHFSDLASFNRVLGDVSPETEDFDQLELGTAISTIISDVLEVSSPFPNLEVYSCGGSPNCLFGSDSENTSIRQDGEGRYELQFLADRNALAFDIVDQDPNTGAATVEVVTDVGSVTLGEANPNAEEATTNFFGIILTLPIQSTSLVEGAEASGGGSEEVALDNFIVASTLLIIE